MSKSTKPNLAFRPARVENDIQEAISKQDTTRLNVEISKELAIKLKVYAAEKQQTIKDIVSHAIEAILI